MYKKNKSTDEEKIPNTITGFLPIRSATIPHAVEVKALPSMYEAPAKIQNRPSNFFSRGVNAHNALY
jgi:hypothetical protein